MFSPSAARRSTRAWGSRALCVERAAPTPGAAGSSRRPAFEPLSAPRCSVRSHRSRGGEPAEISTSAQESARVAVSTAATSMLAF